MNGTTIPPIPDGSQQDQPIQAPPPLQVEQFEPTAQSTDAIPSQPWASSAPAYPPYQGQYQGGYQGTPPIPPTQVVESAPPPRRRSPAIIGAIVVLLLTLAIGIGAGTVLGRATTMPTATGSTVVLGSSSAPAITVSQSTTTLEQDVKNVARSVAPSVVKITSTGGNGSEAVGSGNILTSDGYIVTNDHVVQGFTNFTVRLSNGATYTAKLIGEAPSDDLAVIKISATGLTPIAFADSSQVQVGEFAIAIGNPLNLGESVTFGVVSRVNQTASEQPNGPAGTLTGLIQTSAPINPGNSGGALVNLKGQLIGIPTLAAINNENQGANTSIGFAISSNRVQYIAKQLIAQGKVTSTGLGFIGIEAQDVTVAVASANGLSVDSGVLVRSFVNDAAGASPAKQAGLQAGDVITAVGGTTITNNSDLASALQNQAPGAKVTFTIVRGTSTINVTVTLGERPVSTNG